MNKKRIFGLVIFIIGVVILIFGLYQKSRLTGARKNIGYISNNPFGGNKTTDTLGDAMESKVAQYDRPVFFCIVGGIVLIVIGGGMTLCCRSKGKRR